MINRETIWNESYRKSRIYVAESTIGVLAAIHHYEANNISRLDLCSELSIQMDAGANKFNVEVTLTADQMEELSNDLATAALHVRELQAMLAADAAEIEAAARQAIDKTKEAT